MFLTTRRQTFLADTYLRSLQALLLVLLDTFCFLVLLPLYFVLPANWRTPVQADACELSDERLAQCALVALTAADLLDARSEHHAQIEQQQQQQEEGANGDTRAVEADSASTHNGSLIQLPVSARQQNNVGAQAQDVLDALQRLQHEAPALARTAALSRDTDGSVASKCTLHGCVRAHALCCLALFCLIQSSANGGRLCVNMLMLLL